MTQRLQELELLLKLTSFVTIIHHLTAVLALLDDKSLTNFASLLRF